CQATAEADFKHMICWLKPELAQRKMVHSRVVTVHHEPDHGSHESIRTRELPCDEAWCHRSKPQAVSRNVQFIQPVSVTEFFPNSPCYRIQQVSERRVAMAGHRVAPVQL